jgi:hypothetical protein
MPKVSISLSADVAEAIKQEGKSLNEVVKEIVLQHARSKKIELDAEVVCGIVDDVRRRLDDLYGRLASTKETAQPEIYVVIGELRAVLLLVEKMMQCRESEAS